MNRIQHDFLEELACWEDENLNGKAAVVNIKAGRQVRQPGETGSAH